MKAISIIYIFLLSVITVDAQTHGRITDKKGKPIQGATVTSLPDLGKTRSDINGQFSFPVDSMRHAIIINANGFNPDTVSVNTTNALEKIILTASQQLSGVTVVSKNTGVIKSGITVIQTEKITAKELTKAACCNLSESFETNPSVDVAYSDAATGAKQIKLLGLSGSYVQMLTENVPGLRGIASTYGLGFIPGTWMESIQVSKGASSVINGYEATTGQINVEYRKPQVGEKATINLYASNAGRIEANATASVKLSDYASTSLLVHYSDESNHWDKNNDHFMDMPMIRQYNVANRWFYRKNNYISQFFIRALSENRMGGQTDGDYKINVDTKRYEFFAKNGYIFNADKGTSIGFIVSGSLHHQESVYGLRNYDGRQNNLYANLIFQTNLTEKQKLSTGASFNLDYLNENLLNTSIPGLFKRNESVPGVFAEYALTLSKQLVALAGVRLDYHSDFGAFVTPRWHLKYSPVENIHFRASAGKGYRAPKVLAENTFLLTSNRKINIDADLKMEDAWNYGASAQGTFHPFGKEIDLTAEWYYTSFNNQVIVDMDSDPHAAHFSNQKGKSYAQSIQLEANIKLFRGFSATLAHRITDTKSTIGGILREKPLTNRYKSLITASYQTHLKKWQFDFTTQFNGGGRLPDPDAAHPLWEKEYQPFTIMNAQVTKFFKTWSIYLGAENLTNFVQQHPIADVSNPFGNNFDASIVWGPMQGRTVYVGLRWALDRDN